VRSRLNSFREQIADIYCVLFINHAPPSDFFPSATITLEGSHFM
jgi:hypothetical protein